jgi:Flp pilus assembly protein TadG
MSRAPKLARGFAEDRGGATAVEFALVLPGFLTLMIGGLCAGQLAFAVGSLHFAVQEGARCAAVQTTVCTSPTTTTAYAKTRYNGPEITPTFTYSTATCGHAVSATGSYAILLPTALSVPVAATACVP